MPVGAAAFADEKSEELGRVEAAEPAEEGGGGGDAAPATADEGGGAR